MVFDLHSFTISLVSNNEYVISGWQQLFDLELASQPTSGKQEIPDLVLEMEVKSTLPGLPSLSPTYTSTDPPLKAYLLHQKIMILRLSNVAQIQIQFPTATTEETVKTAYAQIVITEPSLHSGDLDGVTTLALAPILRRLGLFLVHAFTASKNEKAVMFVGPSGSGKTSSGLSLVAAGWHFLANDMALVRQSNATLALLSPGTVQVSPSTISLLPQFSGLLTRYPKKPGKRKISVPRSGIFQKNEKVQSAEVRFILFPTVKGTQEHQVKAVPRAVGLARLMKSSMDQWDKETWKTHVRFLEQLSYQVDFYDLELGKDMTKLPQCLESVFAEH